MKKAIMTVVNGEKFEKVWEKTEPFFVAYAEKCDAELIVLKSAEGYPSAHWIKFGIRDLLKKEFDRVAFIDADCIIRPDTPSLFDIVPKEKFGIFNEGMHSPRSVCIYEAKKVYNVELPKWDGKTYFNTGVMVVSREHRHLFAVTDKLRYLRNSYGEQTYLNLRILSSEVNVFPLPYKFNRMAMMDRITGMSRLDSYIIHYAGFEMIFGEGSMLKAMDRDISYWERDAPDYKYKRKIFVWSLGGLGDIIAAEPVIRYMKNVLYADADIFVLCRQPELYRHIDGINLFDSENLPKCEIDAVYEVNTHPSPADKFSDFAMSFSNYVPHAFIHPIDWVSLNTINRQLPIEDRRIKLPTTDDLPCDVSGMVLVHAGKGWETKTFPVEWWQEVVNKLDSDGYKVCLIGKTINEDQGIVNIDCPPNGLDLRDKLSVQQLINVTSKAEMIISNDSCPVYIAGAFDTKILLIPTCKHPDMILPYRGKGQYENADAIYKRLIETAVSSRAADLTGWQVSKFVDGHTIEDYLPEPQEVVEKAEAMLNG